MHTECPFCTAAPGLACSSCCRAAQSQQASFFLSFQLGFYKGLAGSQVTLSSLGNQVRVLLEEQARHLLTEQERATLAYYLQEYRVGSVSVDALTMALFELLNTHAKVTLLPSVPSCFPENPGGVRTGLNPQPESGDHNSILSPGSCQTPCHHQAPSQAD